MTFFFKPFYLVFRWKKAKLPYHGTSVAICWLIDIMSAYFMDWLHVTNHFKHLLLQRVKLIHTKAITVTAFASLTPCCVHHPSLRSQCCSSSKWKHTQTHTRTHTDETTFWAHSLLIHLALPSAHTPTQTAPVWNQGHLWCWHLVCVCIYMCV